MGRRVRVAGYNAGGGERVAYGVGCEVRGMM